MIVRPADGDLLLITQPDHAHLARRVMERCAPLASHARRGSILVAIAEHDNGWAEEDAAPIVDPTTGGVADFIRIAMEVRHRVWPRGVARLAADPWAAALVAQHAVTVYDRFRSERGWAPFFAGMEQARDAMVAAAGLPLDDLLADYPFVRLGDLISLAFCAAGATAQGFAGWHVSLSGDRVIVSPGAFDGAAVPIEIDARRIRGGPFASDEELRVAVDRAPVVTLRSEVADAV
jgi:hypothetical protein